MNNNYNNQKGALLLEILLAVAIGAIIIGAVSGLVYVSSKSGQSSGAKSSAIALAEEGLEAMQSISESDWHNIYLPPAGSGNAENDKGVLKPYYICKKDSFWILCSDTVCGVNFAVDCNEGKIQIDDIIYARKIYIDNVFRKKTAEKPICTVAENCAPDERTNDSSTQKIKVVVSKEGSADIGLEEYLTRWKNNVSVQSDWSGGAGQGDFIDPKKFDSVDLYDSKETIDYTSVPGSIKLKPL